MNIRVVWLGRPSSSPYEAQVEAYRQRVQRRWPAEDSALKPIAGGREKDPRRALKLEADVLRKHHRPGWQLVALDERGRELESEAFARRIGDLEDSGCAGIVFAVGSDLGLDGDFIRRADARISLSKMTLPHSLARLVLWEQLFRATSILSGGAYHRGFVQ